MSTPCSRSDATASGSMASNVLVSTLGLSSRPSMSTSSRNMSATNAYGSSSEVLVMNDGRSRMRSGGRPRRRPSPAELEPGRPSLEQGRNRAGPSAPCQLPRRRWPARPMAAMAARAPHASSRGLNRNVEQQISKKGSHIAYLEGELHGARPAQARERPWLALAVRPIRPVRPVAPRRTAARRHLRGVQTTKRDASSPDLAASCLDPQEGAAAGPSTNRDRAYAKCILHPASLPSGRVSTTPPVHLLNNKRIKGPIPIKQARQSNRRKLYRCNHRS